MTRLALRLFTWLCAAHLLTGLQDRQPAPSTQPRTAADLAKLVDEHFAARESEGFSGVILLAVDGEIVLEKAYGFRDPSSKAPMRVSDVFDIGSLVKPITRAAILKLESQGKLRTSDPLLKYFPDLPPDKHAITIDHVLAHRAGFPDVFGGDYELVDRESVRKKLFEAPLISPVGEKFNYSNAGYSLLAMLVEDLGGKPYEEWVHEHILKPAGVEEIGYVIPHWPADSLAVGARRNGARFGTALDHAWYGDGPGWNLRGNGGMLANARAIHDLFIALETSPAVLPEEARAKMRPTPGPTGRSAYVSAGGNGVFNAVIGRVSNPNAKGIREITCVGMSNIAGQDIEMSQDLLRTVFRAVE